MIVEDISPISPRKQDGFGRNLVTGWGVGKEWPYKMFDEIASGVPEKGAKY